LPFSFFLFCLWKVDLDLGNYERFLDIKLTRDNNITTGKIYQVSTLPLNGFFFTFEQVSQMFLIVLFWMFMFIVCYWEGEKRRLSWKDRTGICLISDSSSSLKLFVFVVGASVFIFVFCFICR